jgi:hypothetical protein
VQQGGQVHREEAEQAIRSGDEQARQAAQQDEVRPHRPSPIDIKLREKTQREGMEAFRQAARSPEILRVIGSYLAATRENGGAELSLRLLRSVEGDPSREERLLPQLTRHQRQTVEAFRTIMGETFSPWAIGVTGYREEAFSQAQIDVTYTMDTSGAELRCEARVSVRVPGEPGEISRELTVPARGAPKRARRESLFPVDPGLEAPAEEQRQVARCFDGIYDGLYEVFFRGDPRVPVEKTAPMGYAEEQ